MVLFGVYFSLCVHSSTTLCLSVCVRVLLRETAES